MRTRHKHPKKPFSRTVGNLEDKNKFLWVAKWCRNSPQIGTRVLPGLCVSFNGKPQILIFDNSVCGPSAAEQPGSRFIRGYIVRCPVSRPRVSRGGEPSL